jgi:hypothetical protein
MQMQPQRQPQRQWAYLSETANQMQVLCMGNEPEPQDMVKAAQMGCRATEQLEQDNNFFESVNLLSDRRREYDDAFRQIISDLNHLRNFLQVERQVMLKGGMSPQLVDTLMIKIEETFAMITQSRIDAERLRGGLQSIRYQACRLSDTMERAARMAAPQERQETARRTKRHLFFVLYTLGGAGIVLLNTSPIAVQLGLSEAGSAVSGAIGSGLIGVAIPGPGGWQ